MNAQHTPGPWGVSSTSMSTIKAFDFMGESNVIIATAQGNDNSGFFPSYDERDANARLIAAAPELLAALRDCLAYMENDIGGPDCCGPERAQARAAINIATGEAP